MLTPERLQLYASVGAPSLPWVVGAEGPILHSSIELFL